MRPPKADSVMGQTMRRTAQATVRMPGLLRRKMFGEPPKNDRGAPLDDQLYVLLRLMELSGAPQAEELGAEEARLVYCRANQTFDVARRELFSVEDREIPGPAEELAIRIYRPSAEKLPACVFYHGGGFVIGCLDGYDGFCRYFAELTNTVVISVAYRLAPENPFPAAVEDTVAAFRWVLDHAEELNLEESRIAVAGDSAGATLAAVVSQEQLNRGLPTPCHQLLIYPKTDHHVRYESRDLFGEGYFLTRALIEWFSRCYLPEERKGDPRVSPILYERLGDLPPTTVITAGFDPLRDEGEAYVRRLKEEGAQVYHRSFDRLVHGFLLMGGVIEAAEQALCDMACEFRRAMHG